MSRRGRDARARRRTRRRCGCAPSPRRRTSCGPRPGDDRRRPPSPACSGATITSASPSRRTTWRRSLAGPPVLRKSAPSASAALTATRTAPEDRPVGVGDGLGHARAGGSRRRASAGWSRTARLSRAARRACRSSASLSAAANVEDARSRPDASTTPMESSRIRANRLVQLEARAVLDRRRPASRSEERAHALPPGEHAGLLPPVVDRELSDRQPVVRDGGEAILPVGAMRLLRPSHRRARRPAPGEFRSTPRRRAASRAGRGRPAPPGPALAGERLGTVTRGAARRPSGDRRREP